ncbi:MAG: hypothetical protein ACJAWL_002628 [Motiliproteus sp.]|jgi:hypothetical protein
MRKDGYIICVDELDISELSKTKDPRTGLADMSNYAWNISNLYEQHELGISASGRFCSILKAQVFDTEDEAEGFRQKQTDRLSKKLPSARLSISKVTNR